MCVRVMVMATALAAVFYVNKKKVGKCEFRRSIHRDAKVSLILL